MSARDRPGGDAVVGGAARHRRHLGAGDQRLGRAAAGVDAGAPEVAPLDDRHPAAGAGEAHRQRRPGLAAADDDVVEGLGGHARPTADQPEHDGARVLDQRRRPVGAEGRRHPPAQRGAAEGAGDGAGGAERPGRRRVPPAAAPSAAPQKAPETMRPPNCTGTLRLGVVGSWSVTSSTSAEDREDEHRPERAHEARPGGARSIQPSRAAQATAAGAIIEREPATMPIRSVARNVTDPPPAARLHAAAGARDCPRRRGRASCRV